jgi:nucleoside-diphosphate-sugar epimerase
MLRSHLHRVLITGASGTLGYNVVRHLAQKHPETRLQILMRTVDAALFADLPNVALEQVDMRDTERLMKAVRAFQPNAIIHSAASGVRPSKIDYFDFVDLNVSATMHLFRASCAIDGCHFINISTGLVYGSQGGASQDRPCHEGDPINTLHPYGASKAAADCLLRAGAERLNRHLTIVRPFSFTGIHDGGDRLFPSLLRAALERKTFEMSPGTQFRDFCAVQDVVEAITLIRQRSVALAGPHHPLGRPTAQLERRDCDGCAAVPSARTAESGRRYLAHTEPRLEAAHQSRLRRLAARAVAVP